ncbi:MAG: ribonuclease Z [Cytophagales bacterium]|nr:MAG: ribonuclease Z [Cytophagales bacterium]TAF59779.1 MAG: ribonuclease Z [Cytophagales bacterium]
MSFSVTFLGVGSAIPKHKRNHTAQLLSIEGHHLLIDCGEGTQSRLWQYAPKILQIEAIFISHLHGDHFLGIFGLLDTMQMLGREQTLHVFGPASLFVLLEAFAATTDYSRSFELIVHPTQDTHLEVIYETSHFKVSSFPLNHGVPCTGFRVDAAPNKHRLKKDLIPIDMPISERIALKEGQDIFYNNQFWLNSAWADLPYPSASYAFCSDTCYDESILAWISDVKLLYHEATFLHADLPPLINVNHSSAAEAATIAQKARAQRLLIGHLSGRYNREEAHLKEARVIFAETYVAREGQVYVFSPKDNAWDLKMLDL